MARVTSVDQAERVRAASSAAVALHPPGIAPYHFGLSTITEYEGEYIDLKLYRSYMQIFQKGIDISIIYSSLF